MPLSAALTWPRTPAASEKTWIPRPRFMHEGLTIHWAAAKPPLVAEGGSSAGLPPASAGVVAVDAAVFLAARARAAASKEDASAEREPDTRMYVCVERAHPHAQQGRLAAAEARLGSLAARSPASAAQWSLCMGKTIVASRGAHLWDERAGVKAVGSSILTDGGRLHHTAEGAASAAFARLMPEAHAPCTYARTDSCQGESSGARSAKGRGSQLTDQFRLRAYE